MNICYTIDCYSLRYLSLRLWFLLWKAIEAWLFAFSKHKLLPHQVHMQLLALEQPQMCLKWKRIESPSPSNWPCKQIFLPRDQPVFRYWVCRSVANPSLRMRNESSYSEPGGSSSIVFVGNWKGKYMQIRTDSLEINCLINCSVSCLLSPIIGQVLIEANFEVSEFFPSFVDPWGSIYLNGRSNSPREQEEGCLL